MATEAARKQRTGVDDKKLAMNAIEGVWTNQSYFPPNNNMLAGRWQTVMF